MAHVKIKWDNKGFKEILNSDGMKKACIDAAEAIASRANLLASGYSDGKEKPEFIALDWKSSMKGGRAAAVVGTHNNASKIAQAQGHILETATYTTKVL